MPNLQDYKKSDIGIFLLIQGGPNTGKTTAALSFPNVVDLDFDVKMPAVALKHFPDRTDIAWEHFQNIFELSDTLEKWQSDCPYDTIVVDSITSLAGMVINSTGEVKGETVLTRLKDTEAQVKADRKANKKDKEGYLIMRDQVQPIGRDYYNTEAAYFCTYFITALKTLWIKKKVKNIIVIAHSTEKEDAKGIKTKSILTVGNKAATWIPTQFDDCFTFFVEKKPFSNEGTVRKCYTVNKGEESSRTTLVLPEEINLDEKGTFYDKIKGALENR